MPFNFLSAFSSDIAIDLGTANTLIYAKGLGIIAKIAVVVLIAKGLLTGAQGKAAMLGFAGAAILVLAAMLLARRHLGKHVELDAKKLNL